MLKSSDLDDKRAAALDHVEQRNGAQTKDEAGRHVQVQVQVKVATPAEDQCAYTASRLRWPMLLGVVCLALCNGFVSLGHSRRGAAECLYINP